MVVLLLSDVVVILFFVDSAGVDMDQESGRLHFD